MTTIALLSVSAGAGHVRAAEALAAAMPGRVGTVHIDVMDCVPKAFKALYATTYLKVVEHSPQLWGYMYRRTDRVRSRSLWARLRRGVERLNTGALRRRLAELAPDAVICTHFLPAQVLSRMVERGQFDRPLWVQVTDFDVHGMWIHDHVAGYFAANEEIAWRMVQRGVAEDRVHVTGIPIAPCFAQPLDRRACAIELGLDPDRPTVLMMAGGHGVGGIDQLAGRLLDHGLDAQILALAGRNQRLLASLQQLQRAHPGRMFPLPFTRTIERIMACSDIAVTKPGGLTSSECLAVGLPMIIVAPIPGQEERNADHLLESGAALRACDDAALEWRVRALLEDRPRLAAMRAACLRIGRPHAAADVLRIVLGGGDR